MARWGCYDSRGQEPRVRESTMKPVGKPDARNGHVRFDERGRETGRRSASVPAPVLDSTCSGLQPAPKGTPEATFAGWAANDKPQPQTYWAIRPWWPPSARPQNGHHGRIAQ